MATPLGVDARVRGCPPVGSGQGMATASEAMGLALERALLAIEGLRAALDEAARHHAEVAAQLAQATARAPAAPPAARPGGLSPREAEILRLLALGGSNHQIARALGLSPRTVQRHIANIYLKIGAHNKADAAAYALRHRLI